MKCPRCETAALDERERNGVTVDVCASCRGVWLDRGELEKVLAFAKRDLDEERAHYDREGRGPPSSDRQPHAGSHAGHHRRKKGWLENLGDIFD